MTQQFYLEVQYARDPRSWMNRPFQLREGWNWIGDSFGVHFLNLGEHGYALRMTNGATGPGVASGGFHFDRIVLRTDVLMDANQRVGHRLSGGDGGYTMEIGNGISFDGGSNEYMPPRWISTRRFVTVPWWRRVRNTVWDWFTNPPEAWRACYSLTPRLRKHPHLALPVKLATPAVKRMYDDIGESDLRALRTGVTNGNFPEGPLGCWRPRWLRGAGGVGGTGIELFPGFERSPLYRLVAHDSNMEKHAVAFVDVHTGIPIKTPRHNYRTTRGYGKVTQLAEFCKPLTGQGPESDQRIPRDLNTGNCPYRDALVPSDDLSTFYRDRWQPHDDEHLVRATSHAKAAALLYGDPVAKLDLEQIAADAFCGLALNPMIPPGQGTDQYGRGLAHSGLAIAATGWFDETQMISDELERIQHLLGSYQTWLPPPAQYWHAPNPRNNTDCPPGPLGHTLEVAYLAVLCKVAGANSSAVRASKWMSAKQPRQWIATDDPMAQTGEVESFSCWALWGLIGDRSVMQRMVPPGSGVPCGPDIATALVNAGYWEASAKAIEACES